MDAVALRARLSEQEAELERHRKALLLKNSALDWSMGHLSKCGNGSIPKFMREARVALTQDSPPG